MVKLVNMTEAIQRSLRAALGNFATGVTVMTTRVSDARNLGLTVNSFSSLSLEPPLILWTIAKTALCFNKFQVDDLFCVNILSADQESIAKRFAQSGIEKFEGVRLKRDAGGAPLLEGCVAYLECNVSARYPGGDHDIVVGHVNRIGGFGGSPLVFHAGGFCNLESTDCASVTTLELREKYQ